MTMTHRRAEAIDFVLALHSHLPYVLGHGRWPHGSDWLCEAALDTYLPLLARLRTLAAEQVPVPITIGFTPVLAAQLASAAFVGELEAFFDQRLAACDEAARELPAAGEQALLPLTDFWRARFTSLRALFRSLGGDVLAGFRQLEDDGRIEIMTSAATHAYLPLLAREESVRLQLVAGRAEHRRLFGREPGGCWLPECGYRPGLERPLAAAGVRYFFVDAHVARAGQPLGAYGDVPLGAERFDAERHDPSRPRKGRGERSPYVGYQVPTDPPTTPLAALVRDPRSSLEVWSRRQGYPGDAWYLEFHKIRWPGGLKLWRVTGPDADLGDKQAYDPNSASRRVLDHAAHFTSLLSGIAEAERDPGAVVVAPFDTELFGHWWFEGVDFLGAVYRHLAGHASVRPRTASGHLTAHPPRLAVRLARGSWGLNGDDTMWLNDRTAWTWERLWALEQAFWDAAPAALESEAARPVLAQAARELLLAQASDWQFIISTDVAADYGERRFTLHAGDAERLIAALTPGAPAGALHAGRELAEELGRRDQLFPEILPAVESALAAEPAHR